MILRASQPPVMQSSVRYPYVQFRGVGVLWGNMCGCSLQGVGGEGLAPSSGQLLAPSCWRTSGWSHGKSGTHQGRLNPRHRGKCRSNGRELQAVGARWLWRHQRAARGRFTRWPLHRRVLHMSMRGRLSKQNSSWAACRRRRWRLADCPRGSRWIRSANCVLRRLESNGASHMTNYSFRL